MDPRKGQTGERAWTLYIVTFSDGGEASTLDAAVAKFAQECCDTHAAIERVTEPGKRVGSFKLIELRRVDRGLDTPMPQREPGDEQ